MKKQRKAIMQTIYTLKETCQFLKIKRSQVLRWIYSGKLRAFKLGGGRLWRIRECDLRRFIRDGNEPKRAQRPALRRP